MAAENIRDLQRQTLVSVRDPDGNVIMLAQVLHH
jgi:hypothetical protein